MIRLLKLLFLKECNKYFVMIYGGENMSEKSNEEKDRPEPAGTQKDVKKPGQDISEKEKAAEASGPVEKDDKAQKTKAAKDKEERQRYEIFKQQVFRMVSTGVTGKVINQIYDVVSITALILNLIVSFMQTYDGLESRYSLTFSLIEIITVGFFAIDYILRLFTAEYEFPGFGRVRAKFRYMFSFFGIVDLLSFLPYYLPIFFPAGAAAFRMLRVIRILRIFRINAYYDSLNVIIDVFSSKKQQLLSSVFIIFIMMLASSLCMYSVEHQAQPDVFDNAFSGLWWAESSILTVGYGDIYPVTFAGQVLGIVISFLGVMLVAIPTGIISAGFVEQYQMLKRIGDYGKEEDIHFIKIKLSHRDGWVGMRIMDINLPRGAIIVAIQRGAETLIPRGNVVLGAGDILIIGAESLSNDTPMDLKEITLAKTNPWVGLAIREIDISRQSIIVMVKRHKRSIIPNGDFKLMEGDTVFIFSKLRK
jgi:voltage-gated potassium channel